MADELPDPSLATPAGARGWRPLPPEEVARLLPQYEVTALLGRGGMGAVYAGRQVALDRRVAIKFLPREISSDQSFVDRFIREARAMARLEHPNIIAVHDFGQTSEGHLYFVMDFVDGATLQQIIHAPPDEAALAGQAVGEKRRAASALAPDLALSFVAQVCEALHYAHEEGVIHRDIKPANVLVDRRGRVKVADFGLARLTGAAAPDSSLTMAGTVMGTPDYMAPEQRCGQPVDHRADIYSTGVMLYEALTGEVPRAMFKAASQKTAGVDPRIDQVIGRALRSEPDERYQSSTEMKRAIDAIRSGPQAVDPASLSAPRAAAPQKGAASAGARAAGKAGTPSAPKKNPALLYSGIAAGVLALVAVGVVVTRKSGSAGAPPAISGAPAGNIPRTPGAPSTTSDKSRMETSSAGAPKTAGGAPGLPAGTPIEKTTPPAPGPPNPSASPTTTPAPAPREWLISKTASVPPPADALEFQGSKYKLILEITTWPDAKAKAEAMGGHLAVLTSEEEQAWVIRTFGLPLSDLPAGSRRAWIGGFTGDPTEPWRWITGEPMEFKSWHSNEPNYGSQAGNPASGPFAMMADFSFDGKPQIQWAESPANSPTAAKGYLVEWDRFSAADAAANDPAKWKDWLADARAHGQTKLGNGTLDATGWHTESNEVFTVPGPRLRNGMARVRFEGEGVNHVSIALRRANAPDGLSVRHYGTLLARDYISLSLAAFDKTGKRINTTNLVPPLRRDVLGRQDAQILEFRAIDDLLLLFLNGELLLFARDGTLQGEAIVFQVRGSGLITEMATQSLDGESPPPSVAKAETPTPAPVTPKPPTEMERWLAQMDGPQQESFQRDVLKPFEASVVELKKGYLAALDGRIAAASKAGQLDDALGWRTERQRFADAGQTIPPADTDLAANTAKAVATALPPMRAQYRTHLARLEADRLAKARAAFSRYDAILTPAITQLTQRRRLDDALLLKNKLEEIRKAWLAPTTGGTPANPTGGTPVLRPAATPKPGAATSPTPAGPRPAVKKYPKGDDRKAAEWVLSVGGSVEIRAGAAKTRITKSEDLPKGHFEVTAVWLELKSSAPKQPVPDLEPLGGLSALQSVTVAGLPLRDESLAPLVSLPRLTVLDLDEVLVTDDCVGYLAQMPRLDHFECTSAKRFTGLRLAELAALPLTTLNFMGSKISDEGLAGLPRLKSLRSLGLDSTAITDAGLAHVAQMPQLTTLYLYSHTGRSSAPLTLAGLAQLKGLKNVETISWNFTPGQVEQEAAQIATLFPRLQRLALRSPSLNASEYSSFVRFRNLKTLAFGRSTSAAVDAACEGVLQLRDLNTIEFNFMAVTDADLARLAQHPGLTRILCLGAPDLTDAGLLKLVGMRQLQRLSVSRCPQLTPAGLAAFQKARPDVMLVR